MKKAKKKDEQLVKLDVINALRVRTDLRAGPDPAPASTTPHPMAPPPK